MKQLPSILVFSLSLFYSSCKNVPSQIYCNGFVVKETIHTPEHEEISIKYTLYCNGEFTGGEPCNKEIVYNPPRQNGLSKLEWCGCDSVPNACDVVLRTFILNGREIKQADCTEWNTCPIATDSCIQNPNRSSIDTVFTNNTIKEFRYLDTITCDCVVRSP